MESKYKLGSLFDGSGGFPLAGILCGITPVWAAEVEPYPIAVTHSLFPDMKHMGDISKINGAELEPVDVITFGSPCQDLSVAGKRAGLKHEDNGDDETTRSGLFMEAVRIIKEMREATNGVHPRIALWENVPGAFSSNSGEDFRIVLEELIKIIEPSAKVPPVPKGGWPYADIYLGSGWSLAYRTFDAQFWGVPQRRRRIHLVVDFRGERAGEVLFKREGLRGYFEEGRTPWQGVASYAEGSSASDDREGASLGGRGLDAVAATLGVNCGMSTGRNGVIEKISVEAVGLTNRGFCSGDKAETLRAESHGAIPMVVTVGFCTEQPVYCLQGNGIDRADTAGCNGRGRNDETCYTLNTIDRPAVAYTMQAFGDYKDCGVASGLKARDYKDATDLVTEALPISIDRAFFIQGQNAQYVPQYYTDGTVPTLVARGPSAVAGRYIVRRLTPTECARLQGFPDTWGDLEPKDELTDEEYRFWLEVRNTHAAINGKATKEYTKPQMLTWYNKLHTDSSEYKMWGNGIALPPALYCMQGIVDALEEVKA